VTTETMNDPQIAKNILAQLKALDPYCLGAWGAYNSPSVNPVMDMGDGLKFKTQGLARWKGYVYIQYDYGNDAYNITFAKIRKYEWKVEKKVEGVYVEQMVEIINRHVR
jgi:hypothetical protein